MYILFNTELKRPLIHPKVGLWMTENRAEADALLDDFHQLVRDLGMPNMTSKLVVKTIKEVRPEEQKGHPLLPTDGQNHS
jgi:hypothetical protein